MGRSVLRILQILPLVLGLDNCNDSCDVLPLIQLKSEKGCADGLWHSAAATIKSYVKHSSVSDNFYDRYGLFTVSVMAQLNKEAQGVPLFDSEATFSPEAPASDQIYPQGTPAENFSAQRGGFFNFQATPSSDARPENFYHYSGNTGFVMFTCIGGDPRNFVREACSFMKDKNPSLLLEVLFLGHWNMAGSGCPAGHVSRKDVPSVTQWALQNTDCSAFAGKGEAPFGENGILAAATRLKFIVGHQHCNCMTNFAAVRQDACLPDTADPSFVDGFVIGSHGMSLGSYILSWDPYPGEVPKCSARFGLPVLRTDDTRQAKKFEHAGPYGAGILESNLTALLSCLEDGEHGTNQCSRNNGLFDQWYSAALV
eukprot:Skav218277  [mRNA]  locus=scaffold2035:401974:411976:- [translate_table: standard]